MATLKDDLRQRDLEAYEAAINDAGIMDLQGQARIAGAIVRGAAVAGWFVDLTPGDVSDLSGKEVRRLMKAVNARYEELTALDPL